MKTCRKGLVVYKVLVACIFCVGVGGCIPSSSGEPFDQTSPQEDMGGSAEQPSDEEMPSTVALLAADGAVSTYSQKENVRQVFVDHDESLYVLSEGGFEVRGQVVGGDVDIINDAAFDGEQWLLATDDGLKVIKSGTAEVVNSPLSAYLGTSSVMGVEVGSSAVYLRTNTGLFIVQGDQLERIEGYTQINAMAVDAQGVLWLASPDQGVSTLELGDEGLSQRQALDVDADQLVAFDAGVAMLSQGKVYTREGDGQWFELEGVNARHIYARAGVAGLWWCDAQASQMGHMYEGVSSPVDGLTCADSAVVDELGRLLAVSESGELLRHDRLYRVEFVDLPTEEITDVSTLQIATSFESSVESVTVNLGGMSFDAVAGDDGFGVEIDPASLGSGEQQIEVVATFPHDVEVRTSAMIRTALKDVTWDKNVKPLFSQYCGACHGVQNAYELDTAELWQTADVPESWSGGSFSYIMSWLDSGNMPPGDLPKLTPAQLQLLYTWEEQGFR